jgi:hypothetical protein
MNSSHGKARLLIDCPNDYHCVQTIFWTLLAGELADGKSWLAEVRGLDMITGGFGKYILQSGCRFRLAPTGGGLLSEVILHEVLVNSYSNVRADVPLELGGPYLGSAYLLLASPDYPPYTLRPPFDGPLDEPAGNPFIPFDYQGWLDGEQDGGTGEGGAGEGGAADREGEPGSLPLRTNQVLCKQ